MAKIKTHQLRIITDDFVYLEDEGTGLAITNDVEDIIHRLQLAWQLGNRRIFYKDEFGRIDEIILTNNRFSHFKEAEERIKKKIKHMMKRSWPNEN